MLGTAINCNKKFNLKNVEICKKIKLIIPLSIKVSKLVASNVTVSGFLHQFQFHYYKKIENQLDT
jgi:hypothetical protein